MASSFLDDGLGAPGDPATRRKPTPSKEARMTVKVELIESGEVVELSGEAATPEEEREHVARQLDLLCREQRELLDMARDAKDRQKWVDASMERHREHLKALDDWIREHKRAVDDRASGRKGWR